MIIKFSEKFADKHLDVIINNIYDSFKKNKYEKYIFDLTDVGYIANQELLVLSSLFSLFAENDIEFEVLLFEKGVSTLEIPARVRKQIIELWVVWEIWRIIPNQEYYKYFGLDGNSIERLQQEDNYYPSKVELYDRYRVTPFVPLDFINNYDANEIQQRIKVVFRLSNAIGEILEENNCSHPFTSNSLGTIISEELYLNFLDHSSESAFSKLSPFAALSISFKKKFKDELKLLNKKNFETEQLSETKSFFQDSTTKEFHNRGYIEFSFLDFGSGIPKTLKSKLPNSTDSEILKFAFQHNSSRHPITIVDDRPEGYISRGLFDALTIVRRYKGLLIARSNYGKILYNFSETDNIEKAFNNFGDSRLFFPGTLISLYIPAIENENSLNESTIKPEISFEYINPKNKAYININDVLNNVSKDKEKLYSQSLQALRKAILFNENEPTILYLSFLGCKIEDRIVRKILIYLMTDYDINIKTNVVIIHSPKVEIIDSVSKIISSLSSVYKKYKIHPLPIINYKSFKAEIHIQWLGIYDESDIKKLDDLLYEEFSLAKSDFIEPSNIEGHILSFDTYGNLLSNFPDRGTLIKLFTEEEDIIISNNLKDLLEANEGIVKDTNKDLYLCNGNYYQREYIEINNIINSKNELENLSRLFFKKLESKIDNISNVHFIGITSTSNKILQSFIDLNLISKERHWPFENYHSFDIEMNKLTVNSNDEYILICDVISTGFLTEKLANKLIQLGAKLNYVGVLVSVIDNNFRKKENYLEKISKNVISLLSYKIDKFEANEIKEEIIRKNIIRINPYTNIPIRLSFKETNYNDSIIFHSTIEYDESLNQIIFKNEFLDSVESKNLKVGYYKFNNVIHPYFFDTKPILDNLNIDILKKIFRKINKPNLKSNKVQIFYPRDSGIKSNMFFTNIKTGLGNDNIEEIEIDRINTNEGWRFPHNSKHLSSKVDNNLCLIIDDGSSTGDSLIQMIDEISFYNANEIILLSFIGRVNDHKREFFSRLSSIKVQNGNPIDLSIFFATHWHIPTYYLDSNPILKETNWLKELTSIPNTPSNIKKIANRILTEIEPKKENFKDYTYLPKIKGTEYTPKKELIIRREEIGKVIGYRLYKESFTYFNAFIKKYSQDKKGKEIDRYKEIELICACFIYEPYLYDKLSNILPDVISLIEKFVRYLIYSFNEYEEHKSYDWDKKDVIHLFFIVFKDDKLITELTPENFLKLIEFTRPKEYSLDYILYKLTRYFPLNNDSLNSFKYDLQIKILIKELVQSGCSNVDILRNYQSFINTLPSKEDFESQLFKIQTHYDKQKDTDLHLDKKQFGHNVSAFSSIIGKLISNINKDDNILNEDIIKVKSLWRDISDFTSPILKFTSSFPDFLTPWPSFDLFNKIEGKNNSVRSRIGFNENTILSLNKDFKDKETLEILDQNIKHIQQVIDVDSLFYDIISNNTTDLKELVENIQDTLKKNKVVINSIVIDENFVFCVPQKYSDRLISKEIINNILNHSIIKSGVETKIEIEDTKKSISITLKNKIKPKEFSNSNREGLRCLFELSKSNLFGFEYKNKPLKDDYIQILTFKKTKNGYK